MTQILLSFVLLILNHSAFAGGLECQRNGTCQCQYDGTCDKDGNPIKPRPVLTCGDSNSRVRVRLGQYFEEMPAEGRVPAAFENVALLVHDYVTTSIHPVFHTRIFQFSTAYCEYRISVDSRGGRYYVLNSSLECEGSSREIRCELSQ